MRAWLLLLGTVGAWLAPYPVTQPCAHAPLNTSIACDVSRTIDERLDALIALLQGTSVSTAQRANLLANRALAVPSLSIPYYDWWNEALHGVAGESGLAVIGLGACFEVEAEENEKEMEEIRRKDGRGWNDEEGEQERRTMREVEGGTKETRDSSKLGSSLKKAKKVCATSFPAAITTSCSFNKTLFHAVGDAIGTEARVFNNVHKAGLTYWTPNVNIFRDPRWGRGQETPGEDPVLNADFAEFFVSGFQTGTEDPHHLKASACCKHFVAYSLEDSDGFTRHNFNAQVTEQDLSDTYLPAFMSCVTRGKASGVMCSYNAVNGVPMCANGPLLTDTLRKNWGFDGYISGDCGAVKDCAHAHHFSPVDKTCATVLQAGLDSDCGIFFEFQLAAALEDGSVTNATWAQAARNLFKVQMRLGMFDPDSSQPFRSYNSSQVDSASHRQLALEAARQGVVLVKNDNSSLPLHKNLSNLAVIGPNGDATVQMQSNYHGEAPLLISPLQGLQAYVKNTSFAEGCKVVGNDQSEIAAAVALAVGAERVVLVLGLSQAVEGEARDRSNITLPGEQLTLLSRVLAVAKKPVILVVMSGGPVDLSLAKQDPRVGAILIVGYPGELGGQAIAETLFGDNNPSGKLTQTWYPVEFINQCKMSDMNMRPNSTTGCPGRTHRFYTGPAVYQFGDGLSFTRFVYQLTSDSTVKLNAQDLQQQLDKYRYRPHEAPKVAVVRVNVTNVGPVAGAEVVLGMVHPPQAGEEGAPLQSLRRYDRVFLEVGESSCVELAFSAHDFAVSDVRGQLRTQLGKWLIRLGSELVEVHVRS